MEAHGSRGVAGGTNRLAERAEDRLRQVARSHGGMMLLVAGLAVFRLVSFVAFATLLGIGGADPLLFRTIIILDSSLSVLLDIVVVFAALMLFSTIRRMENESDRMQVFMDSVYRRLP